LIVVAIASGVGLVLFFSVPVFFSPGGGIGEPISLEEEQEAAATGTTAEELRTEIFTNDHDYAKNPWLEALLKTSEISTQ
jgi:hypothetical protein